MQVSITIPDWATHVLSDLTDMERNSHPVNASKISKFKLSLADDVYFEYGFLNAEGQVKADPLNPIKARNPWYSDLSAVIGPDYNEDRLANPKSKATGQVKRLRPESKQTGQAWRVITYTPKGFEQEALPVIYLQDGVAYYRIAKLAEVLESLLLEQKLRPAHLVFIEPNDRSKDYVYNPSYRAFVTQELIPLIQNELLTSNERILMGASLGGLVSATLAVHHPDLFSTVISQSGAFLGSPEDPDFYTAKHSWLVEHLKEIERLDLRCYLETGTLEWLTGVNRELRDLLKAKTYDFGYDERNAGHNWVNWRNGLRKALCFALKKT